MGPASSARRIRDAVLCAIELLGFAPIGDNTIAPGVSLNSGIWTQDLDSLWRSSVRSAIDAGANWCLCSNGHQLRLVDATRTYSRAYLQFDLHEAIDHPPTFAVLWALLRRDAFLASQDVPALIDLAVAMSARHGAAVGRSLRFGVIDAVNALLNGLIAQTKPDRARIAATFEESLTVVYRLVFLMFAEARGLVPNWHPIYREHYTIESLRNVADRPEARGLWETVQAITRLAHSGCQAGTLIVPAFNGRLFSPSHSPVSESCRMSDEIARAALLSLSTAPSAGKQPRIRIDYRDLGVEQLGAVYETVLDYEPALVDHAGSSVQEKPHIRRVLLCRGGDRRKSTGSFYTPQSITDYLVRRTLQPLVRQASSSEILQLRVLDPSMGSAAFLVAACHFLARAYERALISEGACHENVDESERSGFRRQIAQRCLFGVDLNPTAVQLGRLSLWLATLAADKPLTFLDHHLMVGNSLIGASLIDMARRAPARPGARGGRVNAPLFEESDLEPSLAAIISERRWITDTLDDTPDVIREKERRLARISKANRWRTLADLWCACWFWPDRSATPDAQLFSALSDVIVRGSSNLPKAMADRYLETAGKVAADGRYFHWMLEFPEVYFRTDGEPDTNPGFDAVIGNPPWDMLRADTGTDRNAARLENASIKRFIRDAGIYRLQGGGHLNRYQLFLERALSLVKKGGRLGVVLPSGIATDHTSGVLRRRLLEHCDLDTVIGFDNRRAIFPIHRSVRFVLCTATAGSRTSHTQCRFGVEDPLVLDSMPDDGHVSDDRSITLTPALIKRLSGEHLIIPDLRTGMDVRIVERIAILFPRMSDPEGWGARFGRELNATDDRPHFHEGGAGLPVLEGKHIEPFTIHVSRSRQRIPRRVAQDLLGRSGSFLRLRLAYRDVASATNRMSLIAAVLPAGVVTTHSLFCLKTFLGSSEQHYLCGILNSYVANYLVRQVMTTHLGSTTIEELRVPKLRSQSALFRAISEESRRLSAGATPHALARVQALAARAFKLSEDEFRHVLATFPLIAAADRAAALQQFIDQQPEC